MRSSYGVEPDSGWLLKRIATAPRQRIRFYLDAGTWEGKKRKAVLGDGLSTVLPKRGSLDELGPQTGDPAQTNRRARHVTMRHWITSFTC
jgi:hypothetical protein